MKNNNYFQSIWKTLNRGFKGNSSRTEFVYFCLYFWSISSLFALTAWFRIENSELIFYVASPLGAPLGILIVWTTISYFLLVFRRCRDIGHTWLGFIQFIPIANIIQVPFLMFKKGKG